MSCLSLIAAPFDKHPSHMDFWQSLVHSEKKDSFFLHIRLLESDHAAKVIQFYTPNGSQTVENLAQLSEQTYARLEQLESDWVHGQIPNVASYLTQSVKDDPRSCRDLVELDLEYRWRRFQHGTSASDLDPFGFPQYPQVEHYAALMDESLRPHLLNPELLAEEYRVRTFWGDRPDRGQFLERLPDDADNVKSALDHIDLELEIEGMSTCGADKCSEETTHLFDQRSGKLAEALPETGVPMQVGKYRMEKLLGRGGFGEVWKAFDPDLKRHVALKFPRATREFSAELLQNFRREAEKMAALERVPGVVPVYDAGEHEGIPYFTSLLIEGEDLSVCLKHKSLSYDESARIVADVAETLHRAHLKDLFHRDVKLSNILIDHEGRVFLSDFGLCVSEEEQLHEGHSATGTYAYMAPEQVYGNSHRVDGRTDIYALGVVLYRSLSGRLPFIGNTSVEYMEQTLKKAPRPLRSIDDKIPEELARICQKCLNKQIEDRYSTADELTRDLRNWLAGLEPQQTAQPALATASSPPHRTFSRRHPFVMGIAMLLIATGGLFAWKPDLARHALLLAGIWTDQPGVDNGKLELRHANPISLVPPPAGTWTMVPGRNTVVVKRASEDFQMRSMGKLEGGEEFDIQFDLLEMQRGSIAGFFFGMSDSLVKSRDTYWQAIEVRHRPDGSFELLRKLQAYKKNATYGITHEAREFKLGEIAAQKIRLRILLTDKGIQHVSINGTSFDDLEEEFQAQIPRRIEQDLFWATPEYVRGTGRFGLSCHAGEVIFADPVINKVSYHFDLEKAE